MDIPFLFSYAIISLRFNFFGITSLEFPRRFERNVPTKWVLLCSDLYAKSKLVYV